MALLAVFSYSTVAQQVAAPEITQIIVNETGGVTLFWTPNTGSIDFIYSEVWYRQTYSPDFPNFNKIPDSESPYGSSFYFDEAQANNRLTNYRVVNHYIVNDDTLTINSEDVSAIYLTACFAGDGKIQLSWNHLHPSLQDSAFYIYRQAGTGSEWDFISSTRNTSYQDDPTSGFSNYSYRVYYKNKSNPTASVSNITNSISYSEHQPIAPSITSIEIYPDGATAIAWEKSLSTNVTDYVIYQKAPIGWTERGRTGSPDILSWLDMTTPANCEEMRTYAVESIDDCGETGTSYPDSSKSVFVLYAPEYAICDREIVLKWELYEDMYVDRYEIYVLDNDTADFIKYAETDRTSTEYVYGDFKTDSYCFKVRAVHERGEGKTPQTITSCQYCLKIYYPKEHETGFFRYVSVLPDNRIQLCFEVDPSANSPEYRIERSATGVEGPYEAIATLEPTGSAIMTYLDADPVLKTQNLSYHYLLYSLDSCNNEFPAEKSAQSIRLTAMEDENNYAFLEWNEYDGYLSGLNHYIIHRYINDSLDYTFQITTNSLSYNDMDLQLSDQTLSFAYRVAAVGNAYNMNAPDTAFSNIAPLKRLQMDIWFPNAFSPTGSNKIFRPIYSGMEVETYEFTIFDRYGAAIYQTVEPGGGWDGKINGVVATAGGYGYMLKIKAKNGDRIERRGSMVLIN